MLEVIRKDEELVIKASELEKWEDSNEFVEYVLEDLIMSDLYYSFYDEFYIVDTNQGKIYHSYYSCYNTSIKEEIKFIIEDILELGKVVLYEVDDIIYNDLSEQEYDELLKDIAQNNIKQDKISTEQAIEKLNEKWYDFDDYEVNDYRELFNTEALCIDSFDDDVIYLYDSPYQNIDPKDLYLVIEDIDEVGIEYIAMLGYTLKVSEWYEWLENIIK